MAVERDIIHKSGAWFSYKDQRIGQGRENTRLFLRDNPEVTAEIDAIIRKEIFASPAALADVPAEMPDEDDEETLLDLLEEELDGEV